MSSGGSDTSMRDTTMGETKMREPTRGEQDEAPLCHACDARIEGAPASHGYLLFVRGDRPQVERPPLCERCAHAIGITALWRFWMEEDEG